MAKLACRAHTLMEGVCSSGRITGEHWLAALARDVLRCDGHSSGREQARGWELARGDRLVWRGGYRAHGLGNAGTCCPIAGVEWPTGLRKAGGTAWQRRAHRMR